MHSQALILTKVHANAFFLLQKKNGLLAHVGTRKQSLRDIPTARECAKHILIVIVILIFRR